ncbi:MAG: hypothetical protein AAF530_14545 [Pseudomonadota bacterium]
MSVTHSWRGETVALQEEAARVDKPVSPENQLTLRLWDHWESLRGERSLPSMRTFSAEALAGFADRAFVLECASGAARASLQFVGEALLEEDPKAFLDQPLSALPAESLLAAVTKHCDEVLMDLAPIGFSEAFANGTRQAHAILLPFGEDGQRADALIGVVTNETKLSETTFSVDETPERHAAPEAPMEAFEDTQGNPDFEPEGDAGIGDIGEEHEPITQKIHATEPEPATEAKGSLDHLAADLAQCREMALSYEYGVLKTRSALYRALERAYRFYFEAQKSPDAFATLCAEAHIKGQKRAPFTPVIKLIFGSNYDKGRLSEYAACLAYAHRKGQSPEDFRSFVEAQSGGMKGCATAERLARSGQNQPSKGAVLAQAFEALRARRPLAIIDDPRLLKGQERPEFVLMIARESPEANGRLEVLDLLENNPKQIGRAVKKLGQSYQKAKA